MTQQNFTYEDVRRAAERLCEREGKRPDELVDGNPMWKRYAADAAVELGRNEHPAAGRNSYRVVSA